MSAARALAAALAGALLVAVGARLALDLPGSSVPVTLQTLALLLVASWLPPARAALALGLYLAAGAAGLPVFSGGGAGLERLLGPGAGFLFSFPVVAWLLASRRPERRPFPARLMLFLLAHAGILAAGALGLFLHDAGDLAGTLVPLLPGAGLKSLIAALLVQVPLATGSRSGAAKD